MLVRSKRRLRIGLITSSYPRFEHDGSARFVQSIAEAQAALGHEVHVIAPYTLQVRRFDSPVNLHWFRYILPTRWGVMGHAAALENDRRLRAAALWQAPLFGLSMALQIRQLLLRQRVDLVHAHWAIPSGTIARWLACLYRKPLFISLHGSDMYLASRNAVMGSLARGALTKAQGITACSQPLADSAVRLGAQANKVHVIPYGADPSQFNTQTSSTELRKQLNLPPDGLIILGVGRLVAKKGFDQLIHAMPSVLAANQSAWLVILGEGPQRRSLEQLRGELGLDARVVLPGAVPWATVAEYLAASDVFVMPSVRDVTGNLDGLPNVVLEAMAARLPVVATCIAGIPLAVEDNVNGLLVDAASSRQLGDALVRLLDSPADRARMGLAGRGRIESELNWTRFAERLDEIYEPVLEEF